MKKIGTFLTSSNVLRISDPCYDKKVWCCGIVKNCEVGKWSAFLYYSDEGSLGKRVSEIFAIFGDVSENQAEQKYLTTEWKDTTIDVGVDSGQCGIFDDSKYPNGEDTGEYGDDDSFYGKCCNLTLDSNDSGGVIDFGVVSSSGFGDGSYTCLVPDNENKVSAIRVVFISDEDNEDYEDENEYGEDED